LAKRKRGASSKMLTREILDDRTMSRVISQQNRFLINGKIIDKRKPRTAGIQKSLSVMKAKRIAGDADSSGTNNDISLKLLFSMGCDISAETQNYSLLEQQTDKETIDNPNIFDEESYKKLKNTRKDMTKSFSNPDDPFYYLDDELPRNKQRDNEKRSRQQRSNNISYLMSDLASAGGLIPGQSRSLPYIGDIRITNDGTISADAIRVPGGVGSVKAGGNAGIPFTDYKDGSAMSITWDRSSSTVRQNRAFAKLKQLK